MNEKNILFLIIIFLIIIYFLYDCGCKIESNSILKIYECYCRNFVFLLNNKIIICIFLICIVYFFIYKSKCKIKKTYKKKVKGGEEIIICNTPEMITSTNVDENSIVVYYAGKIYNIKKTELTDNQEKYFTYLQTLLKEGYELDINDKKYKIKNYADLTKFFNYYDLYKKEGKNIDKLKQLYESKSEIITLLNDNLKKSDIICLNNLKI